MKYIFIFICSLMTLAPAAVQAQNFSEWFRQKKTQKEYLLQQIAALEVYKSAIKKGYKVVDEGLNIISDLKDGEFSLHRNYFDGLSHASTYVKQYPKIASIIKNYKMIHKLYGQSNNIVSSSKIFNTKEKESIHMTWKRLFDNCDLLVSELENICSDGSLEMSDKQRTEHIDKIHSDMESNLAFTHSFTMELFTVKQGRNQSEKDIRRIRSLNGIK